MKRLKIKGIEKEFHIESGNVYDIQIESNTFYHQLVLGLINEDSDMFSLSENFNPLDFQKECLFISDILTINPNNKKILNALYKRIQEKFLTNENKELLLNINEKFLSLLEQISLDVNLETDYLTDISINDVLSLYKFSFKEGEEDFLNKIITYIKANQEIKKLSTIITLNFLPLLKENEILLLQKELELLNLTMINFNIRVKHQIKGIEYLTIDMDLCEF